MFASLSSFLPSALQQVSQGVRTPDIPAPPPTTPPDTAAADPPRKREKKEKHASEAFIIVRPPPSMSTQPLSLQVQLVPPQSRHDKPLQALDSSPDDLSTDLQRTHSNGSETSNYSAYTSAGSVSSFSSASTSTSSSARRMIIPLYNLNVHSVMPTTILDAGTDAKVAKFAKRGLEVIGLAFLEPIEVRPTNASLAMSMSARASLDDTFREFGSTPGLRRPTTPNRSNASRAAAAANTPGGHPIKPTISLTPAPPLLSPDQQSQRPSKNLFAKVFRRKGTASASPLSITVPLPEGTITPQGSPLPSSVHYTVDVPVSHLDTSLQLDTRSSTVLSSTTASQTAVLGVHPTLYPPVSNPRGRPIKYIWIVRKWLKGADTNILNGMMGKLNVGARDAGAANTPHIELRFEWCREPKKRSSRKSRADKSSNSGEGHSPSRHRLPSSPYPRITSQTLSPDVHDHRSSIISHHSSGSETATSMASSAHHQAEESDEESEPEDSETPWTCTVTVQRLGQSPQLPQKNTQEHVIRLKVATLAPTPHHPKVVGLLKMPFPLPDIEVERLVVRRRVVTAQGISKTAAPNSGEFILTAEEIKDTVSSTALWLVVREAFGGVGRERRKGKS